MADRITLKWKINGMSCMHCVKAVTAAIASFPQAGDIEVEVGKAVFSVPADFNPIPIAQAIEEAGYEVEE